MTERQITSRIRKIRTLEEKKASIDEQISRAKAEITADMMLRDVDSLEAGGFLVRFTRVLTKRLDSKALKAELPEIAEKYMKQSESYRFSIA